MKKLISLLGLALGLLVMTHSTQATAHNHWGMWGYGHASTLEEGYLRGYADYIRSLGAANLSNAEAQIYYQQAYWQYLKNQKLRVQTYYELKNIHDAYIAQLRAKNKPMTPAQMLALQKKNRPPRLAREQWDSATKSLKWPFLLTGPEFAAQRDQLNAAFAERAAHPTEVGMESQTFLDITAAVRAARESLHALVRTAHPMQYVSATAFLRTLEFEARLLPEWSDVQQNP